MTTCVDGSRSTWSGSASWIRQSFPPWPRCWAARPVRLSRSGWSRHWDPRPTPRSRLSRRSRSFLPKWWRRRSTGREARGQRQCIPGCGRGEAGGPARARDLLVSTGCGPTLMRRSRSEPTRSLMNSRGREARQKDALLAKYTPEVLKPGNVGERGQGVRRKLRRMPCVQNGGTQSGPQSDGDGGARSRGPSGPHPRSQPARGAQLRVHPGGRPAMTRATMASSTARTRRRLSCATPPATSRCGLRTSSPAPAPVAP